MRTGAAAVIALSCALACAPDSKRKSEDEMHPAPVAKVRPHELKTHGHTRIDNYYWLRERENPEVIQYLEAENKYLDASMASVKPLQQKLFDEFKTRIKQTDESVPYRKDGYYYYTRMVSGKNYPIYCRKKGSLEAPEEILLDGNKAAEGHAFFSVGKLDVSEGNDILAYAVDTVGRRFYDIRFRNLVTGEELPDVINDVTPSLAWANDNKTFFYVRQDPQTLRSYQVYRHTLGTKPAEDRLIYEEKDVTFRTFVGKTKSKKYILLGSAQTLSTEYRYLEADRPDGEFQVFEPRRRDHEYDVDHYAGHFYVRTNLDAKNYRLMQTPVERTGMANWREVIPHRPDTLLESVEIFREYLVVVERKGGLIQLRVRPWAGEGEHYIDFGEPAYAAGPTANYDFDTDTVRYRYSSLTTPNSAYDYNMKSRTANLLKRDEVLGGFDPENYLTERLLAPSHDGTRVPISLVYRKGLKKTGTHPLLQYAYGSYGHSLDANFNPFVVSLLDRGFVYALAHIRGGEDLGRQWYDDGKLLKKKNTFKDFIACTEYLVREKYADPKRVYALGGSAGGLLMGAVMNMRPDLYHGIVAAVPFVDVVTTMLDDTIPLTTFEYDEWGNPSEQTYYEYMHSYSPYDQVEAKAYPNLLVTAGLHDSQVQYWEPAKWVARLRAVKKDNNRLLMYTNMVAGHGGASARYKRYEETALQYAFLLDLAGAKEE
ncbi:MAG: S9 family peptidase [Bryobacteraceae bacterium]